MKRIWVLAALVCLLVSGCKRIYPNEYIHVAEHNAPYAYKDDSSQEQVPRTPTASDYYALRSVLSGFVASGVEHGLVQLVSYRGDEEQDLKRVTVYLTEEDPICAYAIDYITLERTQTEEGSLVSVDAVYRRSVGEIESIQFVRGNDAALGIMRNAMTQFHSSATIRILCRSFRRFPPLSIRIPAMYGWWRCASATRRTVRP